MSSSRAFFKWHGACAGLVNHQEKSANLRELFLPYGHAFQPHTLDFKRWMKKRSSVKVRLNGAAVFFPVFNVFQNVAEKYDLMNDVMSAGIHRLWKDNFVHQIMPTHNLKFLDVAGGTGDIAFRIHRFSKRLPSINSGITNGPSNNSEPQITLCDINPAMMEVGKSRANKLGISSICWVEGNAEQLPFEDNSFDVYTIAFGIRNCTHLDKTKSLIQVLFEAHRVLRPHGRFFCLEFSQVVNPVLGKMYDIYSMQLIPVFGQLIAGDWNSYQYLVESIRQFPPQEEFAELIRSAGFSSVNFTNYSFGICAVHSGFKKPQRSEEVKPCK
ncbi:ubiquinone/menaquinone biosynthesis methyltransferase [Opisthorchis viverrini]|uniref:2-methoxy-6-polyprenyl-1,4-benzoquinol methylase, mitochondrial n=1 Tax=Opisthorchis viverrini TaxID=6198 RepID=A0A1S8X6A7_OPIVI|nr:ubiquinone/menaquinone biosynthesis methyltransferase [Opisthorchis viverrini]